MSIVVIGQTSLDIIGIGEDPNKPERMPGNSIKIAPGGVARNVAENLANLGLNVSLVSVVSDDAYGDIVLNQLHNHKVDTRYVRRTKDGMGKFMAMFDHHNICLARSWVNSDLHALDEMIKRDCDRIIHNASVVAVELSLPRTTMNWIFQCAKRHRKRVYGVIGNVHECLDLVDLFPNLECLVCNKNELSIFFAQPVADYNPNQLLSILPGILGHTGIKSIAVTMGKDGVIFGEKRAKFGYCPQQRVDVVNRIGGGDAFFSGLVAGQMDGKTLQDSCDIGNRLAAAKLRCDQTVIPRTEMQLLGITKRG